MLAYKTHEITEKQNWDINKQILTLKTITNTCMYKKKTFILYDCNQGMLDSYNKLKHSTKVSVLTMCTGVSV